MTSKVRHQVSKSCSFLIDDFSHLFEKHTVVCENLTTCREAVEITKSHAIEIDFDQQLTFYGNIYRDGSLEHLVFIIGLQKNVVILSMLTVTVEVF